MKKLFVLSAAFIVLSASAAYADQEGGARHGDGERSGKGMMFEKKDTNGDGYISYDEFVASHKAHFDKIDADGDGKISKDEARAGHEKMRDKMKERREHHGEERAKDQANDR